ncbi:MAG: hypothetical protein ABR915_11090, partial [Thermoguttaceae bacterium]
MGAIWRRPGCWNGDRRCFWAARWLTIALVAVAGQGVVAGLSRAQEWPDLMVSRASFLQDAPPAPNGLGTAFPAEGYLPAGYQAPAGPTQETPLDRALRELPLLEPGAPQAGAPPAGESPLDRAVRELGAGSEAAGAPSGAAPSALAPPAATPAAGGAQLKLIDISLDGLFAAGFSTR